MYIKSILIICAAIIILFFPIKSSAQEKLEVLEISEEIGQSLSKEENDKYNLFPEVDNLYSATLYKQEKNDSILVKIIRQEENKLKPVEFYITLENFDQIVTKVKNIDRNYLMYEQGYVKLSEKLGLIIDRETRDYYDLYPEIENFERLSYLEDGNSFNAEINYRDSNGQEKDTVIVHSSKYFYRLRAYVENFEQIKAGTAAMNELTGEVSLKDFSERGADVLITLKDGYTIEGELLIVKNNVLLLSQDPWDFDVEDFEAQKENIKKIDFIEIEKLVLVGTADVATKMLTGTLIGGGVLMGIGMIGMGSYAVLLAIPGAAVGLVLGLLDGLSSSRPDRELEFETMEDRIKIIELAKFKYYEPECFNTFIQ